MSAASDERPSPSDPAASPADAAPPRPARALWLVGAAIVSAVVFFGGAHLPPRIKLVGLFVPVSGLLTGLACGLLARQCAVTSRRTVQVAVALLVPIAAAAGTWEAHRSELAAFRAEPPSKAELMEALFLQQGPDESELDPETAKMAREMRGELERLRDLRREDRENRQRFAFHLQRRLAALGDWPAPWPTVFWGAELVVAAALGAWIAGRVATLNAGRTPD